MEIITTHLNSDFDGMASMIAARKLYPDAVMSFPGSQEKNVRDFLAKSIHLYDFQRLKNIDLTKVTRLILVDTRQPGRIGRFAECLDSAGGGKVSIHLYDHHPELPGDLKGEVEEIRPVGSTATIFSQIFQERAVEINPDEATAMALAIFEDTGSFLFDTTTPADLTAMAWLLKKGANLNTVSQFISHEMTSHQVTLLHDLMKSATNYAINGIDIMVARIELPDYVDEFALIVRRFMSMENLNCLFALAAMGERLYLIARSRIPEVNAGEIAVDFGGGGHASAASATVRDMPLVEAEEKLISTLHNHVRPASLAGEVMSSPVISVRPKMSIQEANKTIDRYNITVLPVIREDGILAGIISRRVVGKAIYHGLGEQLVSEYMTTEVETLPPTATLAEIQELVIDNRQRFIPIEEDQRIIGVITRTDLLNLLVNDPAHLPKNLLAPHQQPSVDRQRNLNNLLVENLSRDIIILLKTIGEVADRHGYKAYAVGGFVRDLLMRKVNLDLDVVIEGDGISFAKKFASRFGAQLRTHEKFNTAVIIMPGDKFKIDVATARLEYYEHPAALPTVELSSLKLDLYRRDFTINAMALHLSSASFGILVDFFNCQNDLKEHKIRVLHNLSFVEDPTRIFRAIRFEQRMGFNLGRHTERLIKSAVKMNLFDSFGRGGHPRRKTLKSNQLGFRIYNEIKQILSEEYPLAAIRRLAGFDLLKFLHPALQFNPDLLAIFESTQQAVAWYRLLYQEEPFRQWIVFLLALTSRLTPRQLESLCRRLDVPERYTQLILRAKQQIGRPLRTLKAHPDLKASESYRLCRPLGPEGLLFLMGRARDPMAKRTISRYITRLRQVTTKIRGNDLSALGYPKGPLYKRILDRLLQARLDREVDSREDELTFLKGHFPLKRYLNDNPEQVRGNKR